MLLALRRLRLPALIDPKPSRQRNLVLALIVQRLLQPASKLATTRLWHTTTLASELSLEDADEDDLYRAMDWLLQRQGRIEKKLARRHLAEGDHVLYDLSTRYYEGHTSSLVQHGHSRDGKRGRPIIVYGVMADAAGCPVAVQAYPGNTGDPVTVPDQVETLRRRFGLKRVVLVGDRGLLTETQIKHLKRYPELGWISALRDTAIRRLVETQAVRLSIFDEPHLAEIRTDACPGERLVVCHNPMPAEYRRRKREELLPAMETELARIAREVARRTKTPLLAPQIAEKVDRIKNRYKVAKHFEMEIEDGHFEYARCREAIAREAQLDGFHILRTSEPDDRLPTPEVVRSYKNLTNLEGAFRCLKTVDLRLRPIRHRTETRIRSHLFLCLLSYYVEWHLRRALASLLFDDEDPALEAQPSESAKRKKTKRRTEDGLPIQSFATLMAELGTRARYRCRTASDPDGPKLQRLAEPTPLQRRALQLVNVFPVTNKAAS